MRLIGLMPIRNEAWIVRFSLRAALRWCDHVVVLEHASCDDTVEMINDVWIEHGRRMTVLHEADPTWSEMGHRQRMLEEARRLEATHIAIVDADEILTQNLYSVVRQRAELLPPGFAIITPLLNCWRSLDAYRDDEASLYGCAWTDLLFRDSQEIRWQAREDGYEFHRRRPFGVPGAMRIPVSRQKGGVLHLQHASWRRMAAKQALYQMIEALRWPHLDREMIRSRYAAALDEGGAVLRQVPESWWPEGLDRDLIHLDAEPWQVGEIERLLALHGREAFAGLDLFEDAR